MAKVQTTLELIKTILTHNVRARNDDLYLMELVINSNNISVVNTSFHTIINYIKEGKLPTFETIRRSRAKCQELYPELRASDSVEIARYSSLEDYSALASIEKESI